MSIEPTSASIENLPSVSVIVGVYNGEETLAMCLESLLGLDYPRDRYEIIVVENGSTDSTTEIARRYPVRLVHNSVRGIAPARNLGVSLSDAEIIATTDADCVAQADWLSNLAAAYVDPSVGAACGAIVAYASNDRTLVEQFSDQHAPLVNFISGDDEFLPHFVCANSSFRRSLFNQLGGFNERLQTAEDIDLSWRLQLETDYRIVYVPQAVIHHKHRSTLRGLARLYRHHGYGEIMLDTLYGKHPGYPRDLRFQVRRILGQMKALPRYVLSIVVRSVRLALGRTSRMEAITPCLWFVIEWSNIRGKVRGLWKTRLMRDVTPILEEDRDKAIHYIYGTTHG